MTDFSNWRPLDWYAKPFGPGDIDGAGAKKLLGTPNLDPLELLVRETAQNSWDARDLDAAAVDFSIDLRILSHGQRAALHEQVFRNHAPSSEISTLLTSQQISAIEISDRGTVGLGGPIRNDLAIDREGLDTNFIDFVFNIGAPRDVELGGGTYGFGKTISYAVSKVGALVIWSRCMTSRGPEHRFIASAIGAPYNQGTLRYTGRHWWGRITPDERIEPLVGPEAELLGQRLFASRFIGADLGTSLLVLAPKLGHLTTEEAANEVQRHAVRNLWPKLVSDLGNAQPMRIVIKHEGQPLSAPNLEDDELLKGHVSCLRAVRASQRGEDGTAVDPLLAIRVAEIRSERPKALLGHLAMVKFPSTRDDDSTITLMRHSAELVVKDLTVPGFRLDEPGWRLAAVFKPAADVDDAFADAEPPAHDDWIVAGIEDKRRQSQVRIALRRIAEVASDFATPELAQGGNTDQQFSAAVVGDALAGLLAGNPGSVPTASRPVSRPSARKSKRARLEIIAMGLAENSPVGWNRQWVQVRSPEALSNPIELRAAVRVGFDGGSEEGGAAIHSIGWQVGTAPLVIGDLVTLRDSAMATYYFEARDGLAVDFSVAPAEAG